MMDPNGWWTSWCSTWRAIGMNMPMITDARTLAVLNCEVEKRTPKERRKSGMLYLRPQFQGHMSPTARLATAKQVLSELGLKATSIKWDPLAGCRCGCSPVYVLKGVGAVDIMADVFIVGSEKHLEAETALLMEGV